MLVGMAAPSALSPPAAHLLAQALALPADTRAALTAALLESLPSPERPRTPPAHATSPAPSERRERPLGLDVGKGWVADDFDAPLPEELQRLFEGLS